MKKNGVLLALVLLLLLSGCRKQEPEPETPIVPEPPTTEVVEPEGSALQNLNVEISRSGLTTQQLTDAVKTLPRLLQTYLQEAGVEVETVKVTVGASHAATAQTLAAGNIDLAFLPVEEFLQYGGEASVLFADGYEAEGGVCAGTRSLICAAPTEYGGQLVQRAASGTALTWQELDRARWGVLEASSLNGFRSFDLWLADHYEGDRVGNLSQVTAYESYEALFRAAAAEEIDAFVIRDDARTNVADAWTLDLDRTDEGGMRGFGRTASVWDEVSVLDATESLCSVVVAAAPVEELTDDAFAAALGNALGRLAEENPELMLSLGARQFAAVEDEMLNPMRRLVTIEAD